MKIKLIGLEFRRSPAKKYLYGILAIGCFLIGLTYLFAYIPNKNSSIAIEMTIINALTPVFSKYSNIAALTSILSMVCFSVFSAVIFNQSIISDFTGKRLYLLLTYPIKKSSILMAKVIAGGVMSLLCMIICNSLVFAVFYYAETIFPMVNGDLVTVKVLAGTIKLTLLFSVISTAIGLISMCFGFLKRSSHITLIVSFACSILLSNLFGFSLLSDLDGAMPGFVILAIVLSIVCIVLVMELTRRVNRMEGE